VQVQNETEEATDTICSSFIIRGIIKRERMEDDNALDVTEQNLDKYKAAGEIANNTLKALLKAVAPGKTTTELCVLGNKLIQTQCDGIFNNKKGSDGKPLRKGVAFPVCVSVNECAGNHSPMKSEAGQTIAAGDVVKIDLGVHIDFYCAVAAHTVVVGATPEAKASGAKADVVAAALHGAQVAYKLMQPGATNQQITDAMKKVAEVYGVNTVQGVLMHQIKHGVIDGNNAILLREEQDQSVEEFEFEAGRIYTIDVLMSTGAGKPHEKDARPTVYKRDVARRYQLKMQASRNLLSEIDQNFSPFPFSLCQVEDERQARLGLKECVDHGLLNKYPVLYEKPGDVVAQFKYTVLIMPSGVVTLLTGFPVDATQPLIQTDKTLTPELAEIMARVHATKKAKKKAAAAEEKPAAQ